MLQAITIPFIAVALAELGDKTQLAVMCLAGKTKNYLMLLIGAMLGFTLADGAAIVLGGTLSSLIPRDLISMISGAIFIIFGIVFMFPKKEEASCDMKNPFFSSFTLILLSELGDKTQISSGLFAADYGMLPVFIGVMLALLLLTVLAIYCGKAVACRLDKRKISIAAGSLFIVLGLYSVISVLI